MPVVYDRVDRMTRFSTKVWNPIWHDKSVPRPGVLSSLTPILLSSKISTRLSDKDFH
jgi:hypothetical protein